MEQLWDGILDFTSQFVIPDWGAFIGLFPVFLLVGIAIWLILLVRRFATAGPTRRGKGRITPVAPPGVHMPGPSWAPILAAVGAFFLFWGLVVGGGFLWVAALILVVSLIPWFRQGLRDYEQADEADHHPTVVHGPPPPGVHMPGPSFRPVLVSLGVTVLFFGLVFGGWLLAVGVILTIASLLGWLVDARREYVHVVEADTTGHIETGPAPRWPGRLLWVGAILVAVALLVDNGIVPPGGGTAAGDEPGASAEPGMSPGPGASGEPGGQPGASGGPGASGDPGGGPGTPAGDVAITAENIAFTPTEVTAPGSDFTIAFDNRDQGIPHDVDIREPGGAVVSDNDIFPGPEIRLYEVSGLAAGGYEFFCSVHPNMTGTLTVQ